MSLITALKKVPKNVYGLLAIATAIVAIPAGLLAWGPDRPVYTMQKPADHVTFNSITDNPVHGDERNFVQVRNLTTNSKFGENAELVPGNEYEVYVFYHNNAASNLNDAAHNYVGVANGAYIKTDLPASVEAGKSGRINGYVGASNATPKEVWDEAYVKNSTAGGMDLRIVAGSAKITNNGKTDGQTLSDNIFTTGTSLGFDKLDGKLPGCTEYSGYVTYRFTADQPNFTIAKTVSLNGESKYSEEVVVKPGDLVDFKLFYKNTGTTQQDNVVLRDSLPKNLSYVNGSTYVSNSTTGNKWVAVKDDTIAKQGVNIGSYTNGGGGFIKFTAKVAGESALECGVNNLVNTGFADTQNGSKSDTASVKVTKDCVPPKKVKACNLDTMKIENDVDESKIDGKHYTTDLSKCEVKPPVKVKACEIKTKKIVMVEESKIDDKTYTLDLSKCKEVPPKKVKACNLDTMKIENDVDESKIDGKHYTTDLSKCEVKPPVTPPTPETPEELPHTGITDGVMSIIGASSLTGLAIAYATSRRLQ